MRTTRKSERGVTLIQVALLMVVILGFTALTVDYGAMVVNQRKLQNATDAAALAGGPELYKPYNSEATGVALEYLVANHVDQAGDVRVADVNNYTLAVTATRPIPTPFGSAVENMLQGWAYDRSVQGKSIVQASHNINPASLRPLSNLNSFVNIPNVDNIWELPFDLVIEVDVSNANNPKYYDSPGNKNEGYAHVVPIDIDGAGSAASYKQSMKYGLDGPMHISKNDDWVDTQFFVKNPKKLADWLANEQIWQTATYEAVVSDPDSILNRAGAGTRYANDTWQNFQDGNPRFVSFLVINRDTGGNKGKLKGYIGFWIEGMVQKTIDGQPGQWVIQGRFLKVAQRWNGEVPDPIPHGDDPAYNTGIFSYRLIQ